MVELTTMRSHALSFRHELPGNLDLAAAGKAAQGDHGRLSKRTKLSPSTTSSASLFLHELPVNWDLSAAGTAAQGDHGRLSKRAKLSLSTTSSSAAPFLLRSSGSNEFSAAPSQYNALDEPSPLGLRLRKSPSLLELIQTRLSESNAVPVAAVPGEHTNKENIQDVKGTVTSSAADKLKASNFIASSLRIGSWEFISKHEGDLVAKCYFAKKKLVWEVLVAGLKSKIEIQWSDIIGLKANCPDNCPGSLTVVLARQPLFFRETNPQPRKHTLWQASSDFTDGKASIHRKHFLQCPPGMLNKHFEKLIQSNPRLNFLNQQHEFALDSLYFDAPASIVENPDGLRCVAYRNGEVSPISCFPDGASPTISELSSLNYEPWGTVSASLSKEAPSPSSVMDSNAIEGSSNRNQSNDIQGLKTLEQLKVTGLRPSISMSDLMNHIGHQISERVTSENIPSDKALECQEMLENVTQILLSDTQSIAASDEKLMKKVHSLCCLLQDPVASENAPATGSNAEDSTWEMKPNDDGFMSSDVHCFKQTPSISRKESFGDLLLHLPRIASFPKFLFNIAEDDENLFR